MDKDAEFCTTSEKEAKKIRKKAKKEGKNCLTFEFRGSKNHPYAEVRINGIPVTTILVADAENMSREINSVLEKYKEEALKVFKASRKL